MSSGHSWRIILPIDTFAVTSILSLIRKKNVTGFLSFSTLQLLEFQNNVEDNGEDPPSEQSSVRP